MPIERAIDAILPPPAADVVLGVLEQVTAAAELVTWREEMHGLGCPCDICRGVTAELEVAATKARGLLNHVKEATQRPTRYLTQHGSTASPKPCPPARQAIQQ